LRQLARKKTRNHKQAEIEPPRSSLRASNLSENYPQKFFTEFWPLQLFPIVPFQIVNILGTFHFSDKNLKGADRQVVYFGAGDGDQVSRHERGSSHHETRLSRWATPACELVSGVTIFDPGQKSP
jgi:hypothetical protein